MNTATKIKDGHGNILFKMLRASEEAAEMSSDSMWADDDNLSITYDFEDKSLLTFKVIDNSVIMQSQNERC
jgi:hypothetical protein